MLIHHNPSLRFMLGIACMASGEALAHGSTTTESQVYIEYLWAKPAVGALARQETRSFVLEPGFDHQVCVAVLAPAVQPHSLLLEAVDGSGSVVSRQTDRSYSGRKRCYPAALPADGIPGRWAYRVYLDGQPQIAASRPVDVARRLLGAPFNAPSSTPYVLGRPNYDASIQPSAFSGRLVWAMTVNRAGNVTHVQIEAAEGIGERLRARALAAGYLSLYPPDPSRAEAGAVYRRALNFRPD